MQRGRIRGGPLSEASGALPSRLVTRGKRHYCESQGDAAVCCSAASVLQSKTYGCVYQTVSGRESTDNRGIQAGCIRGGPLSGASGACPELRFTSLGQMLDAARPHQGLPVVWSFRSLLFPVGCIRDCLSSGASGACSSQSAASGTACRLKLQELALPSRLHQGLPVV